MNLFQLSRERFTIVNTDITDGSQSALRFNILVGISTLIVCFGLIMKSATLKTGAILIVIMMAPISGKSKVRVNTVNTVSLV